MSGNNTHDGMLSGVTGTYNRQILTLIELGDSGVVKGGAKGGAPQLCSRPFQKSKSV